MSVCNKTILSSNNLLRIKEIIHLLKQRTLPFKSCHSKHSRAQHIPFESMSFSLQHTPLPSTFLDAQNVLGLQTQSLLLSPSEHSNNERQHEFLKKKNLRKKIWKKFEKVEKMKKLKKVWKKFEKS